MTSEREIEALAAKVGVFYHDGKVNLGAPLYAFTPTELRELARRLQPARVPEVAGDLVTRHAIASVGYHVTPQWWDHMTDDAQEKALKASRHILAATLQPQSICGECAFCGTLSATGAFIPDGRWVCSADCHTLLARGESAAAPATEGGLAEGDATAVVSHSIKTVNAGWVTVLELRTDRLPDGTKLYAAAPESREADKPEAGQREGVESVVAGIVRDVAELPDRNSPEDWPEAMLVTSEELAAIVRERLASAQQAGNKCWCETCRPQTVADMRFIVCPDCGNKRCPRANDHRNACTNSNETGQPGSSWAHVKPAQRTGSRGEGE